MIDMLSLRCKSKKVPFGFKPKLETLGLPLVANIDRFGCLFDTRHTWESIPSSFEGMAFKVFDFSYDDDETFFIEIKASPAKLMQGHNVFGSDDFQQCALFLMNLLYQTYPVLFSLLDYETWSLVQIDITYASRAKDNNEARAFINALQNVSYGHTKSRTGYDGTAYFGKKNSRLKKIKVYHKSAEVSETIKRNQKKPNALALSNVYTTPLLQFAAGMIRWECSLYKRYFERMGISTLLKDIFVTNSFSSAYLQNYWNAATSDLFIALKGQAMKLIDDGDVQHSLRSKFTKFSLKTGKPSTSAADSAFRTYRDIRRDGYEIIRSGMCLRTFNHHLKMICECGISRAALQNMTGLNNGAKIIPFVRFIQVDFGAQFPVWYEAPAQNDFADLRKIVNFK